MIETELQKLCDFLVKQGADYQFIKDAENSIDFLLKRFGKPCSIFGAGEYVMLNFGFPKAYISRHYRTQEITVIRKD